MWSLLYDGIFLTSERHLAEDSYGYSQPYITEVWAWVSTGRLGSDYVATHIKLYIVPPKKKHQSPIEVLLSKFQEMYLDLAHDRVEYESEMEEYLKSTEANQMNKEGIK